MKGFSQFASVLAAFLLAACATTTPATAPATKVSASPPTAPSPAPTTSQPPVSSFKETARIEKEGASVVPYPFDNCAVIQKAFDSKGPKHRRIYKGHEVLFCCTPCVRAFDSNPEPYMPRIIAAATAKAAPTNVAVAP